MTLRSKLHVALRRWIGEPPATCSLPAAQVKKSLEDFASLAVGGGLPAFGASYPAPAQWANLNKAEYVKHFRGYVYVAAGAIARKVAMQPVKVELRRITKAGEESEPAPLDHPLVELLDQPNSYEDFTQFDLWYLTLLWLLTTGDSYWWIVWNGLGQPGELWPLPAHWVFAIPSAVKFIDSYRVYGVWAREKTLPAEDVVHLREQHPDWSGSGRYYGQPPLLACAEMVDNVEYMLKRLYYGFRNYAPPGMVFSTPEKLTPDQLKQLYVDIMAQHTLARDTGKPMVAHSGIQVVKTEPTPKEMDYRDSLDAAMSFILSVYGVPRAVVGLVTDTNRANLEASLLAFAENTVNPKLAMLGQHLTRRFGALYDPGGGWKLRVYFEPVSVEDANKLHEDVRAAASTGAVTPNEVRDMILHKGPFAHGGDRPLVPATLLEGDAGNDSPEPIVSGTSSSSALPPASEPGEGDLAKLDYGLTESALSKLGRDGVRRARAAIRLRGAGERRMARDLGAFFRAQRERIDRRLATLTALPSRGEASRLVTARDDGDMSDLAGRHLAALYAAGADAELGFARTRKALAKQIDVSDLLVEVGEALAGKIKSVVADEFGADYWRANVGDATRRRLASLVERGWTEGWTVDQLREALKDEYAFGGARAQLIARTESTGAIGGGQWLARRELGAAGLVESQVWSAVADDRTRETHAEADGQAVGIGESFLVGDYPARYPGDPSLPPEERVNCRCVVTSVSSAAEVVPIPALPLVRL